MIGFLAGKRIPRAPNLPAVHAWEFGRISGRFHRNSIGLDPLEMTSR